MNPREMPWFPNFCRFTTVFAVMVIAELVVLIIALAPDRDVVDRYDFITTASFLAQWIAVFSAGLLCALRPRLNRLPVLAGLALAYAVILAVCAAGSWTGGWADDILGLGYRDPGLTVSELVLGNVLVCALVAAAALRYFYVQQRWRRDVEARAEAQLRALQARIRPHFLFNSMNTIASLIRRSPERAERAVEDLSELFRSVLRGGDGDATLDQELALCRRYLDLESLRLGDRIGVDWAVDDLPGNAALPALTLQPLLENAIYHGIQHLPDGGRLKVAGHVDGDRLILSVENPVPPRPVRTRDQGHGMALDNIRARLHQRFGGRATMTLSRPERAFRVEIELPVEVT